MVEAVKYKIKRVFRFFGCLTFLTSVKFQFCAAEGIIKKLQLKLIQIDIIRQPTVTVFVQPTPLQTPSRKPRSGLTPERETDHQILSDYLV